MSQRVEAGYQVFVRDGGEEVGAVREVRPAGRPEIVIYFENYGEQLVPVTAVRSVHDAMLNPPFGESVPGMAKIVEFHRKNHPSDVHDTNYVRGWSYVMVWSEGLRRADQAKALIGEGIKAALETLKDFDVGGLAAPVTYTAADHRPTTKVSLYQIQGGKIVKLGDQEQPRKKEWLGL